MIDSLIMSAAEIAELEERARIAKLWADLVPMSHSKCRRHDCNFSYSMPATSLASIRAHANNYCSWSCHALDRLRAEIDARDTYDSLKRYILDEVVPMLQADEKGSERAD